MPTRSRFALLTALAVMGAWLAADASPTTAQPQDRPPAQAPLERNEIVAAFMAAIEANPTFQALRELRLETIAPLIPEWEEEFGTAIAVGHRDSLGVLIGSLAATVETDLGEMTLSWGHRRGSRSRIEDVVMINVRSDDGRTVDVTLRSSEVAHLGWPVVEVVTARHPLRKPAIEALHVQQQPLVDVLQAICAAQDVEYALHARSDGNTPIHMSIRNRSTADALALLAMTANLELTFLAHPHGAPPVIPGQSRHRFDRVEDAFLELDEALALAVQPEIAFAYGAEPADVRSATDAYRVLVAFAVREMSRQRFIAKLGPIGEAEPQRRR